MGQDDGADWSTTGEGPGAWIQLDLRGCSSGNANRNASSHASRISSGAKRQVAMTTTMTMTTTVTHLRFAGLVRDDKFKRVRISFSDGSAQTIRCSTRLTSNLLSKHRRQLHSLIFIHSYKYWGTGSLYNRSFLWSAKSTDEFSERQQYIIWN